MRRSAAYLGVIVLLATASPGLCALSRQDKKAAKQLLSGKLYVKFDVPCTQGRQPFGVFYSPVVEVSPSGTDSQAEEGASFGWYTAESTVWPIHVNDPVKLDDLDWDDDESSVEIELDGVESADDHHTVVKFIKLTSLADFQAAFDQTFSRRPLQEEHADWPADVRQAIGQRRLLNGMTKRQAYYIVGMPARVEKKTEGDKPVEIWTLHRKGIQFGFFGVDAGGAGSPPDTLRFENGLLVAAATSTSPAGLDLDHP